ncbi:MAG: hypothetical protein IT381_01560 [Deltaproteobacteria bacterium]|nr:hypothetical protein [Deltaproteobacteria bacterium]
MEHVKTAARELYALEALRPLDAPSLKRWQELAAIVFPHNGAGEQRKSARLRGGGRVMARIGGADGSAAILEITDVSWGGLSLGGDHIALEDGSPVEVTAIWSAIDRTWQQVELACRVRAGRHSAGLVLTERDAHRRHDYFARAYYPLYLDHLRALAEIV